VIIRNLFVPTLSLPSLLAATALSACSAAPPGDPEGTAATTAALVAGGITATVTDTTRTCRFIGGRRICFVDKEMQSETTTTASYESGNTVVTTAYNDESQFHGFEFLSDGTRRTHLGATMMGWAWSQGNPHTGADYDGAFNTWTKGHIAGPPPGWALLWGDPALTTSRSNQARVFLSNLAVPASRFPAIGYFDGAISQSLLGGACIARSSDSGKTFTVASADCLSNGGDFYDGGQLTSDDNGVIYAAYWNVTTGNIDVWRAPSDTAGFSLLGGNPFPGIGITEHPVIKADAWSNDLYILGMSNTNLWLNHFNGSSWASPILLTTAALSSAPFTVAGKTLRTAQQFDFDIAPPWVNGLPELRFCHTYIKASGHYGIKCGWVHTHPWPGEPADGSVRGWDSTWTTENETGDQVNPDVAAVAGNNTNNEPPDWRATWYDTQSDSEWDPPNLPDGSVVHVVGGFMRPGLFILSELTHGQVPCAAVDYWGDYDALHFVGFDTNGHAHYLKTFSDSTSPLEPTCTFSDVFAQPLHVSLVHYD